MRTTFDFSPLSRSMNGRSFDPEMLRCMGDAFEAACKKLGLNDKDDPFTQLVAERVIAFAQRGIETDPATLSESVIRSLSQP